MTLSQDQDKPLGQKQNYVHKNFYLSLFEKKWTGQEILVICGLFLPMILTREETGGNHSIVVLY